MFLGGTSSRSSGASGQAGFFSRSRTLKIQVSADEALLDRGRAGLVQALGDALDEAERSLPAKRLKGDLGELRRRLSGL